MKKLHYYILAIISIACVACSPCKKNCPATGTAQQCAQTQQLAQKLVDTSWTPTFLKNQGEAKYPQVFDKEGEYVFIHFGADGKVNGMSGDNLFGGTYKIGNNGSVVFSQMFSTRRAGPYGEYEQKFLTAVSQTNKISMSGDTLVFAKGADALVKFKQINNLKK